MDRLKERNTRVCQGCSNKEQNDGGICIQH